MIGKEVVYQWLRWNADRISFCLSKEWLLDAEHPTNITQLWAAMENAWIDIVPGLIQIIYIYIYRERERESGNCQDWEWK